MFDILEQVITLLDADILVHSAGNGTGTVNALARRDANYFLSVFAQQHALFGDFRVGGSNADNIALGNIGIETEQQVGRTQVVEMQRMRLQHLSVVHQPAHLLGSGRQRGTYDHVHCFGCREVVAYRAYPAQPLHHYRRFPIGPPLDEFFEAAKFDDVQPHLVYVVVVIQQQRYLAMSFYPRYRVYCHTAQVFGVNCSFQIVDDISHIQLIHVPIQVSCLQ